MTPTRTFRPAAAVLIVFAGSLFAGTPSPVRAADTAPNPSWDPTRTTSPDTVEELKALQASVKAVVDKVTPTVVAVLVGPGAGSGVIVREDGLVLTAAHVIGKPGLPVKLVLTDGKVVNGKSLGVNAKLDSGMLIITDKPPKDAKWPGAKDGKWPVAEIAKSGDLKKGQWVVSLGHPGGPKPERRPPVRVGRFDVYTKIDQTLRTDCTLVGGDSGGPLYDLNGKVVGIHSRIGLWLDNNMHVATEAFKDEWQQLVDGKNIGKPTDAELGVVLDESKDNVTIESVVENSPAAKAGLKPGDVIVKYNDERLMSPDDLPAILLGAEPGQKVVLKIQRGEKTLEITVTLGKKSRPKSKDKEKE